MKSRSLRLLPLPLLLVAVVAAGCANDSSESTSHLPTTTMQIGSKTFTLEIANTYGTREHGLMERDSMPDDHGMIFVFDSPTTGAFWMKNTRFALDIVFVDSDGKVVAIKQMKPYDLTPVPSPRPYQWAIELNKGAAEAAGLKPGDALTIPAKARSGSQ